MEAHDVGKIAAELFEIEIGRAIARELVGDHQHRGARRPGVDRGQPMDDPALHVAPPGPPDQHEQRLLAQEELMRRPIDLLPTEVPARQVHLDVAQPRVRQRQVADQNAVGLLFVWVNLLAPQRLEQRRLAHRRLADHQHLGPPVRFLRNSEIPQIGQDRRCPLLHNLRRRRGQPVLAHIELGQFGEPPKLRRQRRQ